MSGIMRKICDRKQGNYSLRRPPKLIIPQIFIEQRWATVYRFMCNICISKQLYMMSTTINDISALFKEI